MTDDNYTTYRGTSIRRTPFSMYEVYNNEAGRFIQFDTIEGCQDFIAEAEPHDKYELAERIYFAVLGVIGEEKYIMPDGDGTKNTDAGQELYYAIEAELIDDDEAITG